MRHAAFLLLVAVAASAQPQSINCRSSASACMASTFYGATGSVAAPTFAFVANPNSGLFMTGNGPAISHGGSTIGTFGSSSGIAAGLNTTYGFYCSSGSNCGYQTAAAGPVRLSSEQADSASVVGGVFNSINAYVTAGAKLWVWRNNNVDKASVDKDGAIASLANVAGAIKVTGTGSIGVAGATDATIDALSGATGTYHYNSDTDRPEFATSTRWNQLGGAVQWALERRTLAVNPFLAESTLCPRCTECHGTTLTAMDGQTCTDSAAGTTSTVNNIDFRNFNTTAVANNVSGWITRVSETRLNQGPHAVFIVYVAAITLERVWYGLSSAVLSGADLPAASLAAFRFSTAAADTTWMACTGNGTTTACTTVGSAVTANQAYRLEVDCRPSASCIFKVEKVGTAGTNRVAVSTNLPVASTGMSVRHYCETLTTAAKTCGFGPAALETL